MLGNPFPGQSPLLMNLHAQSDLGDLSSLIVTVLHSTQSSTIMQTAHILCLTTLDVIQVGQSAVSYLERVTYWYQSVPDSYRDNKQEMPAYLLKGTCERFSANNTKGHNWLVLNVQHGNRVQWQWGWRFNITDSVPVIYQLSVESYCDIWSCVWWEVTIRQMSPLSHQDALHSARVLHYKQILRQQIHCCHGTTGVTLSCTFEKNTY